MNREGIRKIKSVLTNQIFQQELLHIYEDKSQSRDELVRETRSAMLLLAQKMQNSACEHPEAEQMIRELALELGSVKGKKSYGYLPKHLKQKIDAIVDQMELLPSVDECYGRNLCKDSSYRFINTAGNKFCADCGLEVISDIALTDRKSVV